MGTVYRKQVLCQGPKLSPGCLINNANHNITSIFTYLLAIFLENHVTAELRIWTIEYSLTEYAEQPKKYKSIFYSSKKENFLFGNVDIKKC